MGQRIQSKNTSMSKNPSNPEYFRGKEGTAEDCLLVSIDQKLREDPLQNNTCGAQQGH